MHLGGGIGISENHFDPDTDANKAGMVLLSRIT